MNIEIYDSLTASSISTNVAIAKLPASSTKYKAYCIASNCGGFAMSYNFYVKITPTNGPSYWLDIDLSGGSAF